SELAESGEALLEERERPRPVGLLSCGEREREHRVGSAPVVAQAAMERERVLAPLLCGERIAPTDGHYGGSVERPGAGGRRCVVGGEQSLESSLSLCEVTAHVPKAIERTRELQREPRVAIRFEPVEGRAEVVVLRLEPVEPLFRIAAEVRICLLGESDIVLGKNSADVLGFAGFLELLGGVLADRLQHPEALVTVAEHALVPERLEDVEVGVGDLLGGLERAAAAKDR